MTKIDASSLEDIGESELDQLAIKTGADPAHSIITEDPERSVGLFAEIHGSKTYLDKLDKATAKLIKLLTAARLLDHRPSMAREINNALRHIIHTAAHMASRPQVWHGEILHRQSFIAIPRGNTDYGKNGQYPFSSTAILHHGLPALTAFDPAGNGQTWLFEAKKGFLDRKTGHGRRTRYEARADFCEWLWSFGLVFPTHPYAAKKKKTSTHTLWSAAADQRGCKDQQYTPLQRPFHGNEAILPQINERLNRQHITIYESYAAYQKNWDWRKGRLKNWHGRKTLYRQFKSSDGSGGRLQGHFVQQLSPDLRQRLKIDGRPVVELDYSAAQLVLLYCMTGKPMPPGDLYGIPGSPGRDLVKAVLRVSTGTATRSATLPGLRGQLKKLNAIKPGRAEKLYDLFWSYHAAVWPHGPNSCTPWPALQFEESKIALRVLAILLEQDITAIPIHDSFVVKEEYAEQLEAAMVQAFQARFPGYTPKIK